MLEQMIARYKNLAAMCRRLAQSAASPDDGAGLLEIADHYERRVADFETWLSGYGVSGASEPKN